MDHLIRWIIGALNFCLLQWLFVRLAEVVDGDRHLGWAIAKLLPLSGYFGTPCKHWGKQGFLIYVGASFASEDVEG